ncbi:L-threonylcarbamoyladenylate synthase [Thiothrix unzii]|jgi:L-threonylcarbamoyladenylate synthase|uniref:Threonylcarbamoyl-AMP synthase n=1 Tax=Thiothrix unzii TaxID=111769 RepID=A0A975F949_9GAMM|nr:L-threonylcarbamoyladenylate synthase [Thiothrix unzii]QTR53259.1 threonylcarbamoyl-AMP synthase [Thiothrix unzii]
MTAAFEACIQAVQRGGVIAYPTEAVYGLGCDPAQLAAVQRVLTLKQRPAHKGLILIAADFDQLAPYLLPLDSVTHARVMATWPGAVTWILPAQPHVSPLIRGEHDTLAVRVSAHPTCRALCLRLGHPLISTSANLSTLPPARDAQAVAAQFGTLLDGIVDAPVGGQAQPTEIRQGLTGEIVRFS